MQGKIVIADVPISRTEGHPRGECYRPVVRCRRHRAGASDPVGPDADRGRIGARPDPGGRGGVVGSAAGPAQPGGRGGPAWAAPDRPGRPHRRGVLPGAGGDTRSPAATSGPTGRCWPTQPPPPCGEPTRCRACRRPGGFWPERTWAGWPKPQRSTGSCCAGPGRPEPRPPETGSRRNDHRSEVADRSAAKSGSDICWSRRSPSRRCDLAVARHLPPGRHRAGDRHLNFYDSRDNLPSRKRQSRRGSSPTEDSVPPGIQWCMPPMPSFIGVTGTTNGRIISVSSCSSTWQW